ncbi:MAG: cell division protein CrgA [Acidimicrobiales bacterium]
MAKPTKRKVPGGATVSSGRVTPKGGAVPRASAGRNTAKTATGGTATGRYTPPTSAVKYKPSGRWVPYTVFTLLGLGLLTIVVNYMRDDQASNWVIFLGLGFILSGIMVATQWR